MDVQKVYRFLSGLFLILAVIVIVAGNIGNIDYKVSFYGLLIMSTMYSIGNTIINEIRKLKA